MLEASFRGSGPASSQMETNDMKLKLLILAILLGLGGTAATAAELVDADGDGVFSMDEVKAVYPDVTEELFVQLDVNGDGALDAEEVAAAETAGLLTAG